MFKVVRNMIYTCWVRRRRDVNTRNISSPGLVHIQKPTNLVLPLFRWCRMIWPLKMVALFYYRLQAQSTRQSRNSKSIHQISSNRTHTHTHTGSSAWGITIQDLPRVWTFFLGIRASRKVCLFLGFWVLVFLDFGGEVYFMGENIPTVGVGRSPMVDSGRRGNFFFFGRVVVVMGSRVRV